MSQLYWGFFRSAVGSLKLFLDDTILFLFDGAAFQGGKFHIKLIKY